MNFKLPCVSSCLGVGVVVVAVLSGVSLYAGLLYYHDTVLMQQAHAQQIQKEKAELDTKLQTPSYYHTIAATTPQQANQTLDSIFPSNTTRLWFLVIQTPGVWNALIVHNEGGRNETYFNATGYGKSMDAFACETGDGFTITAQAGKSVTPYTGTTTMNATVVRIDIGSGEKPEILTNGSTNQAYGLVYLSGTC